MAKLSKSSAVVVYAYDKGYRVHAFSGRLTGPDEKEVKAYPSPSGYLRKSIQMRRGESGRPMYLHKLMAYQKFGMNAFAAGIEVRHLNGLRNDNCLSNIAIGTRSENMMDRPGKLRREVSRAANLKRKAPDEILARLGEDQKDGLTRGQLSEKYNLKIKCIDKILYRYRTELCGESKEPRTPKLKEKTVRFIRDIYDNGMDTQKEIAVRFNVSQSMVSMVVNRKCYANIE